jgi:hypothetical protein
MPSEAFASPVQWACTLAGAGWEDLAVQARHTGRGRVASVVAGNED